MNKKIALKIMFILLGTLLIFHLLIFTEQIPYDKVWAGKLNSVGEFIRQKFDRINFGEFFDPGLLYSLFYYC